MPGLTPAEKQAWEQAKASHGSGGLSPEERAAWANARPMGVGEDVGRSTVTGVNKAFAGLVSMSPQTAIESANAAGGWLADKGAQLLGLHPAPHTAPTPSTSPLAAFGGMALNATADAATHASHAFTGNAPSAAELARNRAAVAAAVPGQSATAANQNMQAATGPYHVPQTWQGRAAQTGAEMSAMAVIPGSWPARVARVLVPTVASEGAGELARGTKYEPAARTAGALAGGLLEGGVEAAANAPARVLSEAAGNLTPQQAAMVQQLRATAARQGVDLTVPEAVQQVTNGATGMGRLQRLVENSRPTAARMAGYFAQRPDQVRGATMNLADALAPGSVGQSPAVLGAQAQEGAQGALDSVRQGINAQAEPYYAALRNEQMGPIFQGALRGNPSYEGALGEIRSSPELNGPIANLPDGNLSVVNDVVKQLDRNIEAAKQTAMNPSGNNYLASLRQGARGRTDLLASLISPNWRAARDTIEQGHASLLDPLQQGPTGAIAQTPDIAAQTSALYPSNPPLGQPADTGAAIDAMNGVNPDLAAALTRQHVANTFNQSARNLSSGPNQYGGALFAKNLLGNNEQAATLMTGLEHIDPSGGLSTRMQQLADVLQATGRRQQPGSMTAFNAEDQAALKLAPQGVRFLGGLGDPLEWTKNLSNWTGGRLYNRNLNVLADLLTNPDTAAVLQRAQAAASPTAAAPVALLPAALAGGAQ